jgi:3,4-dihydroxy-2-butanone 4-phosphate synthase
MPAGTGDVAAVSTAVAQLARSHPIVLVDEAADGVAVLVHAAETITTEAMAFMVKHTSGLVHVALTASRCAQLRLPPMWPFGDPSTPDYCVTFDAREGTTTGISAHDRALGAKLLASSEPPMQTSSGPATCSQSGQPTAWSWREQGDRRRRFGWSNSPASLPWP